MRKSGILIVGLFGVIFLLVFTLFSSSRPEIRGNAENEVSKEIIQQIDTFSVFATTHFLSPNREGGFELKKAQEAFLQLRILYKKFEWAAEYFAGDLARRLNGPPVSEIENADLLDSSMAYEIDPSGLQVIEEILYDTEGEVDLKELVREIELLTKNAHYLTLFFRGLPLSEWRILDAAKLQVFRVITLGITGYDNPLTLCSMEESAVALEALKPILRPFASKRNSQLIRTIDSASLYLRSHKDFDAFDRALFITEYANHISKEISAIQTYPIRYNRLLRQEAQTLFDKNAFNPDAFVPGAAFSTTQERVLLGKKLFFDASLSGTRTRSCASCHNPDKGFADALATNTNIHDNSKGLLRNTPTILNAGLQANQFYDMRALTLEDQVYDVIHNPDEMGGSLTEIVKMLSTDKEYRHLFAKAYPNNKSNIIDSFEVMNALSAYIRAELTLLNSRFDQYMQGNNSAMTAQEVNGFNLYMGKAKCATCHFIPLFNGLTPPNFVKSEAEVIGTPASTADSTLSPDLGYYNVIGVASMRHAFKTPTVRNANKTAPYMHNGVYKDLEAVMEFYNNAGAIGLGYELPNQTLPTEKLNLSSQEQKEIIAFIKTLDSRY